MAVKQSGIGRDASRLIGQQSAEIYAADSGAADAYVVTLSPALLAYTDGTRIVFKAANANTGASTVNVNALGAIAIKKEFNQALAANDILAGQIISGVYDGTNFQMETNVGPQGATGATGATGETGAPGTAGTAGTAGADGATGATGPTGPTGATGSFGVVYVEVTGTTQAMAVNTGYIANNGSQVVLTLPATAAVGDVMTITGKGSGGWKLAQNATQLIHFGDEVTATGTGGYIESTNAFDTIEIVCITANTVFNVVDSIGNLTIA